MEYVEGTTLATKLDMGPLPVNEAVNYISQVLSAVSYAHQQHIIHRDIKPANMMLTPQGVIKLMDFGIARSGDERGLTMTGTTLGSIGYMSPEQVKGDPVDARSDLYSVGIVALRVRDRRRPFLANSDYSIMAAHLNQTPKPPLELNPGLPAALNEIILMAIAKDPARRFQTAEAFANALTTVPASSAVAPTVPRTPLAGTQEAAPSSCRVSGKLRRRSKDRPLPHSNCDCITDRGHCRTATATTPMPPTATTPMPATYDSNASDGNPPMPAATPLSATTPGFRATGFAARRRLPLHPDASPHATATAGSGHRGSVHDVWSTGGARGLVVAGIYVPRISKTNAKAPDASGMAAPDTTSQAPGPDSNTIYNV